MENTRQSRLRHAESDLRQHAELGLGPTRDNTSTTTRPLHDGNIIEATMFITYRGDTLHLCLK